MRSSLLTCLGVAIAGLLGSATARCGTRAPTKEEYDAFGALHQMEKRAWLSARQNPILVPVYVHVVLDADDPLVAAQIDAQFVVLKTTFQRYGITLNLADVKKTISPDLSVGPKSYVTDEPKFLDFVKATRIGDYTSLNVYYYSNMSLDTIDGGLGFCALPREDAVDTDYFWNDACHVNLDTVPGRPQLRQFNLNLGMVTVHQVGHWFGLLHTFENGCNPPGDMIDDTPYEARPASGCPHGSDTCPQPGLDPIHNYMDYSDNPWYVPLSSFLALFNFPLVPLPSCSRLLI
jgi:hypothetical protein